MKTINLSISDADYHYLRAQDKPEVTFVEEALKEKISRDQIGNMRELLIEGYQATSEEDLAISIDYLRSDSENL